MKMEEGNRVCVLGDARKNMSKGKLVVVRQTMI